VTVFFRELHWLPKWLPAEEVEVVRGKQADFVGRVQRVIERGMADGTFREVDPTLAVSAIVGMAGWLYKSHGRSPRYSGEQLAETTVSLALGGLLARSEAPAPKAAVARARPAAKATKAAKPDKAASQRTRPRSGKSN